jgi:hypothetical protein
LGPKVQRLRCDIRVIGPDDGADLSISTEFAEKRWVTERLKHPSIVEEIGQIDISCHTVLEAHSHHVVGNLDGIDK